MKLRYLKPLRVCIALAFFLPIAFLFLDFRDTGVRSLAGELLYLQFVPSLLKFLRQMAMGATGFIAVLVLTLVFGRIYESVDLKAISAWFCFVDTIYSDWLTQHTLYR